MLAKAWHKVTVRFGCLTAACLLFHAAPAHATLIASDSFDNPPGPVSTGVSITSPGLTYPGLATSGNKLTTANGGAFRPLASAQGGSGTIFISFLAAGGGSTLPDYAGLSLFSGGSGGSEQLFIGKPFLQGQYGIDQSGTLASVPAGTPGGTVSTTPAFLVAEIDYGPGGTSNTVKLYVNPTPGSDPGTPALTTTRDDIPFDTVRLQSGNGAEPFNFDEVRIGTTYADVAPVPEPATLCIALMGGALLLSRRRART